MWPHRVVLVMLTMCGRWRWWEVWVVTLWGLWRQRYASSTSMLAATSTLTAHSSQNGGYSKNKVSDFECDILVIANWSIETTQRVSMRMQSPIPCMQFTIVRNVIRLVQGHLQSINLIQNGFYSSPSLDAYRILPPCDRVESCPPLIYAYRAKEV